MRWGEMGGGGGGGGGGGEHYETTPSLSCPGQGQNGGPPASLKKAKQDLFFLFFFLFYLFRTPGFQKFMGDWGE